MILQSMLVEMFHKKLNKSIDPEEAVAYGAAVQAAVLNGDKSFGECILQVLIL